MLFLLITLTSGFGQSTRKYLVLLRDKTNTPYSLSRPEQFLSQRSVLRRQKQNIAILERDLPVNPDYVTQLQKVGAKIWFSSRWLNAVLVEASDAVIIAIQKLPFVTGLEFSHALGTTQIGSVYSPLTSEDGQGLASSFYTLETIDYGASQAQVSQIGADVMHQQGYHGEGMLIGILDAGFQNADKVGFLKPIFDEKRVLATYDFVKKETSVYEDDSHGLSCLSAIAATADGSLYGTAYKASFILLRTEDAATEKQTEEANWLFGAEYADSAGVDVISSSLGYTQFDDASTSYSYLDMNGKTALSSRAAQIATETGMVVVVAAGNEGNSSWHYLSAPSDAVSVLAIGAVTQAGQRASFSSFGPSIDGRVKPDLDARGQGTVVGIPNGQVVTGNGTSFATPLIAGLATGFWQSRPRLTASQVTEALRRSGSQYAMSDNQLGYGIPNFERASILSDRFNQLFIYPNPFTDSQSLTVQWGEIEANMPLDATLTNLTGRVVWQGHFVSPGSVAFALPNIGLSTGMYILNLVAGDKRRTVKVVKQ